MNASPDEPPSGEPTIIAYRPLVSPANGHTILFVDDDPLVRMAVTHRLKWHGFHVLEADNGQAALEIVCSERPDLVLTDWAMPEMDGLSLCEAIKSDQCLRLTQVILMTSHDQPVELAEGLARGADDFLSKSASTQEMMARVNASLRTYTLVQEIERANQNLSRAYDLVAEKQQALEEDLLSAARLVKSLLPPPGEVVPGLQLAWEYLPSETLGGDMFHVIPWTPEHVGLYILDASGHGVAAALRAAALATAMKAESLLLSSCAYDPGKILTAMNRQFPLGSEGEYFTLWLGCLHVSTRQLRYATAGHAGALVRRANRDAVNMEMATLPLGLDPETVYHSETVGVMPGDWVVLFSDGLYEVRSPEGEFWGRSRLQAVIEAAVNRTLTDTLRDVIDQSRAWQQQTHFSDDAALVGLEIRN